MQITVHFHSYFRDLTGCAQTTETVPAGSTVGELQERLIDRFPKLGAMRNSTLIAVDLDYQGRSHELMDGDEVSFFPPVQGG